jgi:hypothetical protein
MDVKPSTWIWTDGGKLLKFDHQRADNPGQAALFVNVTKRTLTDLRVRDGRHPSRGLRFLASSSRPLLLEGELAIVDREGFVGLRV